MRPTTKQASGLSQHPSSFHRFPIPSPKLPNENWGTLLREQYVSWSPVMPGDHVSKQERAAIGVRNSSLIRAAAGKGRHCRSASHSCRSLPTWHPALPAGNAVKRRSLNDDVKKCQLLPQQGSHSGNPGTLRTASEHRHRPRLCPEGVTSPPFPDASYPVTLTTDYEPQLPSPAGGFCPVAANCP
jgi:hypothetical protein